MELKKVANTKFGKAVGKKINQAKDKVKTQWSKIPEKFKERAYHVANIGLTISGVKGLIKTGVKVTAKVVASKTAAKKIAAAAAGRHVVRKLAPVKKLTIKKKPMKLPNSNVAKTQTSSKKNTPTSSSSAPRSRKKWLKFKRISLNEK